MLLFCILRCENYFSLAGFLSFPEILNLSPYVSASKTNLVYRIFNFLCRISLELLPEFLPFTSEKPCEKFIANNGILH